MKYLYTQSDYIQAITRELNKRETTYPKMIAKMIKNGALKTDIDEQTVIMEGRCIALKQIKNMIRNEWGTEVSKEWLFDELIREYKMRVKCYPRFVMFKRITQQTADAETSVWKELCIWFSDHFMGVQEPEMFFYISVRPNRGRKKQLL